ncbi:Glutamine synthetase type III, GlnN [Mucinivorans hirudinis]|uniref:Glutamine synthetase type III, GlnN n=1 Tax=Mucinivorans hirudinis TaxID=1433126 RepID=A0A060RBC7_9BACT|nr:Glutamine synthetase type III, GlnN [Mucinivorans hirudinis]
MLRFKVVEEAISRKAVKVTPPIGRPSEYYAARVFNQDRMRKYLPKAVYETVVDTMNNHTPLPRQVAEAVAGGMREWAMEMGATHYTHWFQPLTGGTAEKHDAFVEHDGHGGLIEEFSGKLLIQQEGDASSFPNGGTRSTFEARGYSAWDPSSPAFVVGSTLCIPTVFISYTGDALDFKTPLLRSLEIVNKAAVEVCRYFDKDVKKVTTFLGWEQEYFLVDEGLWAARPDLVLTGRTLMGHESAKNQQLEDHYFGSIPSRVTAFMEELEYECWKFGIPVKTRHNEVAPNQFELAPVYEEANLANDHNLLLMSLMPRVASRHFFKVLLHEKPFKGVNGSGKHNNWSLGTDTGVNLFSPGKSPKDNLQFITFLVNTLMAVYKHNGLLKAVISSATNAHRLGANEAPPAIISVFLGRQITEIFNKIESGAADENIELGGKAEFSMGIPHIPELLIDNTDRNRTSPFAFTGNRFEFRAVGSSDNCGGALTVLNAAVAQQLQEFKKEVDALINQGYECEKAIFTVVRKQIIECKNIRFDGNGYSDEWKAEARERGLDCENSVPLIFDNLLADSTISLFSGMGVLTDRELHARVEVAWETYTKKIQIEARVIGDLAMNHILPVASRYEAQLLDKIYKINGIFSAEKAELLAKSDIALVEKINGHISCLHGYIEQLVEARKVANKIVGERAKAVAYHDTVAPLIAEVRRHIDRLELMVDNEMWPLPKYRELLFHR